MTNVIHMIGPLRVYVLALQMAKRYALQPDPYAVRHRRHLMASGLVNWPAGGDEKQRAALHTPQRAFRNNLLPSCVPFI